YNNLSKKTLSKNQDLITLNKKGAIFSNILEKKIGKLTYIDFWASWCIPCLEEMKFTKEINESALGKDINFIFISLDENISKWESNQISNLMNIDNSFLLVGGIESKFAKQFHISTIPRYFLIDNKGKIINTDAYKPSDPNFKNLLSKLLIKK
ncbi:MAG: TlpA disulfide reductase family protein, partial [Ferruginibacter sp.]